MLHLGCAITIPVADGDHGTKRIAEIVLPLYVRAEIETSDVDTLVKFPASATHCIHQQTP